MVAGLAHTVAVPALDEQAVGTLPVAVDDVNQAVLIRVEPENIAHLENRKFCASGRCQMQHFIEIEKKNISIIFAVRNVKWMNQNAFYNRRRHPWLFCMCRI